MTKLQKLQREAAVTSDGLRKAADQLVAWAALLDTAFFAPPVSADEVRAVALQLANQGGRLSMAVEQSRSAKRPS